MSACERASEPAIRAKFSGGLKLPSGSETRIVVIAFGCGFDRLVRRFVDWRYSFGGFQLAPLVD